MGSLRVETGDRGTGIPVSLSVARTLPRTFVHFGFMLRSDRIFGCIKSQVNIYFKITLAFDFPCKCKAGHTISLHTSLGPDIGLNQR